MVDFVLPLLFLVNTHSTINSAMQAIVMTTKSPAITTATISPTVGTQPEIVIQFVVKVIITLNSPT